MILFTAEFNNKIELGRMLQLVLGCAMNCEDKERKYLFVFIYFCNASSILLTCYQ